MDVGYFVVLLLLILLVASLMTVIERKVLGSCQRRMGPSYAGWAGLVQVVGDGMKLVWAWVVQLRLLISVVGALISIYGAGLWIWLELSGCGSGYGIILTVILLGVAHIFLVVTWLSYVCSAWSRLGVVRLVISAILAELIIFSFLLLLGLLDLSSCLHSFGVCSLLGFIVLSWSFLIEFGRIPYDLVEAESELVAGIQTEYAGLGYALLASVEYAAVFLGSCVLMLILGLSSLSSLALFGFWVWLRAVLPRFRILDLTSHAWLYSLSLLFPFLSLLLLLLSCTLEAVPSPLPVTSRSLKVLLNRSYSTTVLLTPSYSYGFCAALFFCVQLVGGFMLACHYQPSGVGAFMSVDGIGRELDAGMIMRSIHANGASLFSAAVLLHMLRCIYHASPNSRPIVWSLGVTIYLMLCGCCFTGYSLVYGQMSLWAMVVICSLVTAIPVVGVKILAYLWGGLVVSGVTVNRFFCIHFILPLVLVVLVCAHLFFLHAVNSTGELGIVLSRLERCNFMPLLLVRDVAIGSIFFCVYGAIVCWNADVFGHADNYVPANPLVTPALIAPEWYFLPFYGLIRAIPQKALGVCVMVVYVASFFTAGIVLSHSSLGIISTRLVLGLFLLDTSVLSYCCLCVNLAESVYWLLVSSVLGMCLADFISSSPSLSRSSSLLLSCCSLQINGA
jgi:ubiquinol-cytochrome c reductase cytochrome b subunit